jgi:hypothetical protein
MVNIRILSVIPAPSTPPAAVAQDILSRDLPFFAAIEE